MNSAVGPIFNEKVDKKSGVCGTCEQCTSALFTEEQVNHCGWKEKKKKNWGNADAALISAIQTST